MAYFRPDTDKPVTVALWKNFDGGYALGKDPDFVGPNEFSIMENVMLENFVVVKCPGSLKEIATALPVTDVRLIFIFTKESDLTEHRVAVCGDDLYKWDGTSIKTDFTEQGTFCIDAYFNKMYVVNGKDGLWEYDGTAIAQVTPYTPGDGEPPNELADSSSGIHKCTIIKATIDTIYLSGSYVNPSYVWISKRTNPSYFPVTYTTKIHTGDGQIIRAVYPLYNSVVIWKDRSVYAIPATDPTSADFQIYGISNSVGCVGQRCVAAWPQENALLFLDRSGLFKLKVSDRPDVFLLSQIEGSDALVRLLSDNDFANAEVVVWDNKAIVRVPEKWYVYDLVLDKWIGIWTKPYRALFHNPNTGHLYSGHTDGFIRRHSGRDVPKSDDGAPIISKIASGWVDLDAPEMVKLFLEAFVHFGYETRATDTYFFIGRDYVDKVFAFQIEFTSSVAYWGVAKWGVDKWSSPQQISTRIVPPPFNGVKARFLVEHRAAGDFKFNGLILKWKPLGWRNR